ncbi:hypothetical protein Cni_G26490 [Canna indica]|uniref:Protein SHORT HYPOCOTYL IN WHITE LIGHT 1 n=1 Tax=Canna indica TaxID=4628 RepID=A0AAQ3KZ44_9LILI|nr:hypothetical protein Cni_G26490 [Canna indica]
MASSCSISASISFSARRLPPSYCSETYFLLRRSLPLISFRRLRSRSCKLGHREKVSLVPETRAWVGDLGGEDNGEEDGEYAEDEEDEEHSLDLAISFLRGTFGKMSRRMRKAARSVLPPFIPTKLVSFSVNGVLILAFLWIVKAFIEVICTLASVVFASVLLVRAAWSFLSYLMENQHMYTSRIDNEDSRWSSAGAA